MSGPIVRQYGVPNWDDIFGKKDDADNEERAKTSAGEPPAERNDQTSDPRSDAEPTSQ